MRTLKSMKSKVVLMTVAAIILSILLTLTAFAAKEPVQLGVTERAWWSDVTTARWKKVDKASKYQVQLYENGQYIRRFNDVTAANIDLSEYISEGCDYYFMVRAYARNSSQISGEWMESEMQTVTNWGDTTGRWRTYQQGKKYRKSDGEYVTACWYQISGSWYYFSEDGYSRTGWILVEDKWYYLDAEGVMQTGWKQIDDSWYFLNADGSMAVGWVKTEPSKWYYFYEDGKMATDTVIDGRQIDASGLCVQ